MCPPKASEVCRTRVPVLCPLQNRPSPPIAGAGIVPAHKQCSTYFERGWDIILGPAQDRPLRAAEHVVAIFKIFVIRVKLKSGECTGILVG